MHPWIKKTLTHILFSLINIYHKTALAIIGISDHHTRVVTGGSALPKTAPVVGLLFGYYSNESSGGGSGKFLC